MWPFNSEKWYLLERNWAAKRTVCDKVPGSEWENR